MAPPNPYYEEAGATIYCGNALDILQTLPDESVQCCVTSPPYFGLRDYGVAGQLGLEPTPDAYVANMVAVFREVRRVLKNDGVLWLNLGDSFNAAGREGHGTRQGYKQGTNRASANGTDQCRPSVSGLKPKDLIGIPWLVAFALRADGWYLRQDIIWSKPNPMPESVRDRCTKSHEYLFLLAKSEKYYYDNEAIREQSCEQGLTGGAYSPPGQTAHSNARDSWKGSRFDTGKTGEHQLGRAQSSETRKAKELKGAHGTLGHDGNGMRMLEKWNNPAGRNKRSVWTIATQPYPEAHFATFPPKLIEPCILAGSRAGDIVLDPFIGSGTTVFVAKQLNRRAVGIDLNAGYLTLAVNRLRQEVLPLT